MNDLYLKFGGGPRNETREQLEQRLRQWKDKAIAGWASSSETYLAATVRPGLRFHLRDNGGTFLNHVEIVITIQGTRGIEWKSPDDFELDKLLPPIDPPDDIYGFQATRDLLNHLRPKDYPLKWENRGDAVVVTINLGHLRPTGWSSNDDDIVLEVSDPSQPLTAQWRATAQGYGKVFVGSEVLIPVEVLTPRDAFTQEAEKRGSSG